MTRVRQAPSRRKRLIGFAIVLVAGACLIMPLVWPQAFGLQRSAGIAQLIAFRAPLALSLALLLVVASVTAVLRRRIAVAAALALVLAVGSIANGVILIGRGGGGGIDGGDLTVLAWNTQGGATSPEHVARVATDARADIVSLPETDTSAANEMVRLLAREGLTMTAYTAYLRDAQVDVPTSVLIADHLGPYRQDASAGSTPGLPSGVWRPIAGDGPVIVAAHPLPPLPRHLTEWDIGLRWVADVCDAPNVIVAGDLNATVDHMSGLGVDGHLLGRCDDAALAVGAAASGTWPSDVPTWLASPIDHVLVGTAWSVRGARVIEPPVAGSDHRPIVVALDKR